MNNQVALGVLPPLGAQQGTTLLAHGQPSLELSFARARRLLSCDENRHTGITMHAKTGPRKPLTVGHPTPAKAILPVSPLSYRLNLEREIVQGLTNPTGYRTSHAAPRCCTQMIPRLVYLPCIRSRHLHHPQTLEGKCLTVFMKAVRRHL